MVTNNQHFCQKIFHGFQANSILSSFDIFSWSKFSLHPILICKSCEKSCFQILLHKTIKISDSFLWYDYTCVKKKEKRKKLLGEVCYILLYDVVAFNFEWNGNNHISFFSLLHVCLYDVQFFRRSLSCYLRVENFFFLKSIEHVFFRLCTDEVSTFSFH